MIIDSHNHTSEFSSDAHMLVSELLASAEKNNIGGVVITEHMELDFPHPTDKPFTFDLDDFFTSFREWQTENQTEVVLLAGVEFGFQKHLFEVYDKMAAAYPFDSIILSNHLFRGKDPYFFRDCYLLPKEDLFAQYLSEMTQMVELSNGFDIVGHYDYIARYAEDTSLKMRYDDAPEAFDRFLKAVAGKGKSLEINTRSIYKMRMSGSVDALPDRKILQKYYDVGGRKVTLGSDSHDPSTVGIYFQEVSELLRDIGFPYLTYFVNRSEHRISL